MKNIRKSFLAQREGVKLIGYIPLEKDGTAMDKSGVTIGTGFDIGQQKLSDLKGLDKKIQEIIKPYLGIKGQSAIDLLEKNKDSKPTLTAPQELILNTWLENKTYKAIQKKWNSSNSKVKFEKLPEGKATALYSASLNFGLKGLASFNLWTQATSGKWEEAAKNLETWSGNKQLLPRRKLEAGLIRETITKVETTPEVAPEITPEITPEVVPEVEPEVVSVYQEENDNFVYKTDPRDNYANQIDKLNLDYDKRLDGSGMDQRNNNNDTEIV